MSVEKYHDVSDMPPLPITISYADAARRFAAMLDFWRKAVPRQYPRGVERYRSIEEANTAREAWLDGEVGRLRRERNVDTTD